MFKGLTLFYFIGISANAFSQHNAPTVYDGFDLGDINGDGKREYALSIFSYGFSNLQIDIFQIDGYFDYFCARTSFQSFVRTIELPDPGRFIGHVIPIDHNGVQTLLIESIEASAQHQIYNWETDSFVATFVYPDPLTSFTTQRIADRNHDMIDDYAAIFETDEGNVIQFRSGADASVLEELTASGLGGVITGFTVLTDLTGDNRAEIALVLNDSVAVLNGEDHSLLFSQSAAGGMGQDIQVAGDLNEDGADDLYLIDQANGIITLLSGVDGAIIDTLDISGEIPNPIINLYVVPLENELYISAYDGSDSSTFQYNRGEIVPLFTKQDIWQVLIRGGDGDDDGVPDLLITENWDNQAYWTQSIASHREIELFQNYTAFHICERRAYGSVGKNGIGQTPVYGSISLANHSFHSERVTIELSGDVDDFFLSGPEIYQLPAAWQTVVEVGFAPLSTGEKSVTITATPEIGNPVSFELVGSGIAPEPVTDIGRILVPGNSGLLAIHPQTADRVLLTDEGPLTSVVEEDDVNLLLGGEEVIYRVNRNTNEVERITPDEFIPFEPDDRLPIYTERPMIRWLTIENENMVLAAVEQYGVLRIDLETLETELVTDDILEVNFAQESFDARYTPGMIRMISANEFLLTGSNAPLWRVNSQTGERSVIYSDVTIGRGGHQFGGGAWVLEAGGDNYMPGANGRIVQVNLETGELGNERNLNELELGAYSAAAVTANGLLLYDGSTLIHWNPVSGDERLLGFSDRIGSGPALEGAYNVQIAVESSTDYVGLTASDYWRLY